MGWPGVAILSFCRFGIQLEIRVLRIFTSARGQSLAETRRAGYGGQRIPLKGRFGQSGAVKDARHLLRLLALVAALCGASGAVAGIRSERLLIEILRRTPVPMMVAEGRELAAAEKHAAALPGAQAFLGIGRSMEPLYAPNTAIVVEQIDYDDLKKGMTVVFVSRRGARVAHVVIGETRGGYITQGAGNDREDEELVTVDNYVGVVVDAYASADTTFRTDLATRLAAKGRPVRLAERG